MVDGWTIELLICPLGVRCVKMLDDYYRNLVYHSQR